MKTSSAFLSRLRACKANRDTPRIAVKQNDHRNTAIRELASLIVQEKPVTSPRIQKYLHAAFGAMYQKRRRCFRLPAELPVKLLSERGLLVKSTTSNISDRGLAVTAPDMLEAGQRIHVTIALPASGSASFIDNNHEFRSFAEIVWSQPNGQMGVRFLETSQKSLEALDKWLTQQFEMEHVH